MLLHLVLVAVYFLLIVVNYIAYKNGKGYFILTVATAVFATILLFSSNSASLDWADAKLDMPGYRTIYEQYDVLEHPDFKMYYIFYGIMYLAQSFGLSYYTWWAAMSVLGMSVIVLACKIHGFNYNLFLASFMAYYEFVFYSGFKFFYGFCFFLLAYGFLLRDDKFAKIKFTIFLLIAGGFHAMYYFFLLFLIQPRRSHQFFTIIITIGAVLLTVFTRLSGSALSFLAPFFNALDNDHINRYTVLSVNMGFYLPIFLQVVLIFIAYIVRHHRVSAELPQKSTDTLFYSSILSLFFCPFFSLALTFSRIQTAFSLALITANSIYDNSQGGRELYIKMSLLMVGAYWLNILISGWGGFIRNSVLPFFDVF